MPQRRQARQPFPRLFADGQKVLRLGYFWNLSRTNDWTLIEKSVTVNHLVNLLSKLEEKRKKCEENKRELGKENELNGIEATILSTGRKESEKLSENCQSK